MAAGLPYDSDAGRDYAACVTAIMCGQAYLQSSRVAELCQPLAPITDTVQNRLGVTTAEAMPGAACPGFYINREPFLGRNPHASRVRKQHQPEKRPRSLSSKPPKPAGTKPWPTAKNTATATAR